MHRLSTYHVLQLLILLMFAVVLHRIPSAYTSQHALLPGTTKSLHPCLLSGSSDNDSHPLPTRPRLDIADDLFDKNRNLEPGVERADDDTPYHSLFNQLLTKASFAQKLTSGATERYFIDYQPLYLLTLRIRQ